jgi:hypothetical protein
MIGPVIAPMNANQQPLKKVRLFFVVDQLKGSFGLSWSTTKKSLTFFNGCWFAFMGAITGPIMAAGMYIIRIVDRRLRDQ